MNIDEFLDKETSHLDGKARIMSSEQPAMKQDDSGDIFKQIQLVREQMEKKELATASKEFKVLRERYIEMTKKQYQQNHFIFNELLKLNNDLIGQIKLQADDTGKKISMIKHLLSNAKDDLQKNKIDDANKLYLEVKGIYNKISNISYEEKRKINEEILSFYVLLSKYIEVMVNQDWQKKKGVLETNIRMAHEHLMAGNHDLVKADFERIQGLYEELPEGFAHEKAVLYQEILKLFSSTYLMRPHTGQSAAAPEPKQDLEVPPPFPDQASSPEPVADDFLKEIEAVEQKIPSEPPGGDAEKRQKHGEALNFFSG